MKNNQVQGFMSDMDSLEEVKAPRFGGLRNKMVGVAAAAVAPARIVRDQAVSAAVTVGAKVDDRRSLKAFLEFEKDAMIKGGRTIRQEIIAKADEGKS